MEILLALALAAVVLGLLGLAVDVHLRVADACRKEVEETQLARFVLQRIGEDLRNAMPVMRQSSFGAAGGDSSQSSGGSQDPAQQTALIGGISGTSREMQVSVSHMPLLNALQAAASAGDDSLAIVPPSDVRIVMYRMAATDDLGRSESSDRGDRRCGLLRGEWERATFAWALQQGHAADLDRNLKTLASEVEMIEFTYFDDTTTYQEWDSLEQGKLPTAVKIAISIRRPEGKGKGPSLMGMTGESRPAVYDTLVFLPNARATLEQALAVAAAQAASTSQAIKASDSGGASTQQQSSGTK